MNTLWTQKEINLYSKNDKIRNKPKMVNAPEGLNQVF